MLRVRDVLRFFLLLFFPAFHLCWRKHWRRFESIFSSPRRRASCKLMVKSKSSISSTQTARFDPISRADTLRFISDRLYKGLFTFPINDTNMKIQNPRALQFYRKKRGKEKRTFWPSQNHCSNIGGQIGLMMNTTLGRVSPARTKEKNYNPGQQLKCIRENCFLKLALRQNEGGCFELTRKNKSFYQ